jgi:hypothetical protein
LPLLLAAFLASLGLADAVIWPPSIPNTSLWQLDLLYLDEPAPAASALGLENGAGLLVVCEDCPSPEIASGLATVVTTADPRIASAYGLLGTNGAIGPGYAIVANGRVRYRTFDQSPADHLQEIEILLRAVR